MQDGGIGEKEERALELFRKLNETDKRLFIMMGWDIFLEATRSAVIFSQQRKKIEIVEVN